MTGRRTKQRVIKPLLTLASLLKRRKTTLEAFVRELGITTYPSLEIWCRRIGVLPPPKPEFYAFMPTIAQVNSPHEGIVVIEPQPDQNDVGLEPDEWLLSPVEVEGEPTEPQEPELITPVVIEDTTMTAKGAKPRRKGSKPRV